MALKRGRPKKIQGAELLWQHFTNYKTWVEQNPILVQDYVGKDGDEVERKRQRPLTMEGFEMWCFNNGIINDIGDYFSNKDNRYESFAAICRAIKREIRNDQITGGLAGIYNPSITQRLNGLADNQKQTVDLTAQITGMEIR